MGISKDKPTKVETPEPVMVEEVKPKTVKPKSVEIEGGSERPEGCNHCQNTGLEPGYGLAEGIYCTVCHGSPFIVKFA